MRRQAPPQAIPALFAFPGFTEALWLRNSAHHMPFGRAGRPFTARPDPSRLAPVEAAMELELLQEITEGRAPARIPVDTRAAAHAYACRTGRMDLQPYLAKAFEEELAVLRGQVPTEIH